MKTKQHVFTATPTTVASTSAGRTPTRRDQRHLEIRTVPIEIERNPQQHTSLIQIDAMGRSWIPQVLLCCCVMATFLWDCSSIETSTTENASYFQENSQKTTESSSQTTGSPHKSRPKRKKITPDEQILLETLLDAYHKYSRPVVNASQVVTVKFGLTLVQISDMDEVNQVLTLNVWLEQEWVDERLTWDPKDYNDLNILRIPCEKLWLPDVVLYNSADDFTAGYMNSKAMVRHDGNVFWPPPAKFRSSCTIDITYFPFDDQICELKFGSWTYDGFQVDITNRSATVDLQNYVLSGEWELVKVGLKRTEVTYACCKEPYPDVRFTIVIRRKTLFYLFNIIFPCLWLTILSLLGFWLPPDSGEKITLGITVLLAFSVFMLLIAESMPATSDFVPLIGIYLTVTMGMTSLSIILTVFVLQLHHIGPHQKPVPRWLRTIVFDFLARIVCLCYASRVFRRKLQPPSIPNKPYQHNLINTEAYPKCSSHQVKHIHQQSSVGSVVTPSCNGLSNNKLSRPPHSNKSGSVHVLTERELVQYPAWSSNSVPPPPGDNQALSYSTTNQNVINSTNTTNVVTQSPRIKCQDRTTVIGGQQQQQQPQQQMHHQQQHQQQIYHHQQQQYPGHDYSRSRSNSSHYNSHHAGMPSRRSVGMNVVPSPNNNTTINNHHQWWNNVTIARNSIAVASGYNDMVDPTDQVEAEWQFVAHVMDRLLFWLFLFVAFMSSLAILVIKPLLKPQDYEMDGLYDAK